MFQCKDNSSIMTSHRSTPESGVEDFLRLSLWWLTVLVPVTCTCTTSLLVATIVLLFNLIGTLRTTYQLTILANLKANI
jgi:hypothetical protein